MDKNNLPTAFVVFGATGDLFNRKLIPAIFNLYLKNLLPENFILVGFSRKDLSNEEFKKSVKEIIDKNFSLEKINITEDKLNLFLNRLVYIQGDFNHKKDYKKLADFLGHSDKNWQTCANKLFYLATPPKYYKVIFKKIADLKLNVPCGPSGGWTRIAVEKPFGKDLKTAKYLDELLGKLFLEEQIYRVDHYLAKETTQNILAFRFSNSIFEPLWNKDNIESITIRLFEKNGIEGRGDFYDGIGALRDVGQNHLLQLLALFTMEKPEKFKPNFIRKEKAKILSKLKIFNAKEVELYTLRGQYEGYLNEKGVKPNSKTETYFKIKTFLDSPSWRNVPIYLEAGKKLKKDCVEIEIVFRHSLPCFCPENKHFKNILHYLIQPNEKISLSLFVKKPNSELIEEKDFIFDYRKSFESEEFQDAYEKLLLDIILGNQTLFVSTEELLSSWKFIDSILKIWRKNKPELLIYKDKEILNIDFESKKVQKKEIGIIGLGKMGKNIALNLLDHNWKVFGYDKNINEELNFKTFNNLKDLTLNLNSSRIILLSVPHQSVSEVIWGKDGLVNYLTKGDIVLDFGNSFYENSVENYKKLKKLGIKFMDIGISGGPSGARHGASLMLGGDKKVFEEIKYLFEDLALPGGYAYFGKAGSGHFVKMVHNGIEYGIMQAIAEGFNLMKNADFKFDLQKIAEIYNNGSVIESKLIEWLRKAYEKYGENLEEVSGSPGYSGEGEWTVLTGKKFKLQVPVISKSFEFRVKSKKNPNYIGKIIQALRNQFGGHNIK